MGLFVTNERVMEILKESVNHKVVSMTVENFMAIKERTTLTFDESNIVQPVGYNDSGKTAFCTSQEVLHLDSQANRQSRMIHTGQHFFLVENLYSDGVRISRKKFASGESVWEMWQNDELIYANRSSKDPNAAIISTQGVPLVLQKYFNVAVDSATKELVNFRKNRDKLFLVHTSTGDNGKIINSHLQLDNVTKGLETMNRNKNKLTSSIVTKTSQVKTLQEEVQRLKVMTEEEEAMIKETTEKYQKVIIQGLQLERLTKDRETIRSIKQYDELAILDDTQFRDLMALAQLSVNIHVEIPPEVEEVNTEQLHLLRQVANYRQSIDVQIPNEVPTIDTEQYEVLGGIAKLRVRLEVPVPPEVEELSTSQYASLITITNLRQKLDVPKFEEVQEVNAELQRYVDYNNVITNLQNWQTNYAESQKVETELAQVQETLKQLSETYNYKICNTCGTIML